MNRLFSDVTFLPIAEESLRYLIEEHGFKIMHTQNVNSAKFLEAMKLWESGESQHDPRKVAFHWKEHRGLSVKEALTAQKSGHWLVISRPHIGKILILDQDDGAYKKALKDGNGEASIQRPMSEAECEAATGEGTYIGCYRTPHGYHHILTEAIDPEIAGNGAWRIGEFEGDVRCDKGYAVMYAGDALADVLRGANPSAPKCDIRKAIGYREEPAEQSSLPLSEPAQPEDDDMPCPSLLEMGQALNLKPGASHNEMMGACFKCKEGATRFHASIEGGKALFYCFKGGEGTESCNGVNDPQSIAKIFEAINNRGDGAAAIAKIHRIAKRADPEEVCRAQVAEVLEKFDDLTDYQREWIDRKVWNEWYPDAVMTKQVKLEKDELNAKHKRLLNDSRKTRADAAEEKAEKQAAFAAQRADFTGFDKEEVPFEKGDINAFPFCLFKMGRAFRYNVIKMRVEYQAQPNGIWTTLDDHEIDELFVDIGQMFETADGKPVQFGRGDQMTAYKGNVYREKYNPWQTYIDGLPAWDGIERIHRSMDMGGMTIRQSPISAWSQGVPWVDMVRNGLYPGSPRFPEVVLFGQGGRGKSSFLARMLPAEMRGQYFLEGCPPIDSDDKIQIEKGAFLLCEGKEFGGGSKRDWEKVKEMWDKRIYTARLAYGRTTSHHRRCDTRVYTTNRRQLPEDDTAVSRRFLAVKVDGKVRIENRRNFEPWDWMDILVDVNDRDRGTYRDQMFAEAVAIISHHGGATIEDGRWVCSFNYLNYMAPTVAHDPDAMLQINKEAGVAYGTEEGAVRMACADALNWYRMAGVSSSLRGVGVKAGGVYDEYGILVAVKPRGLFSMMLHLQAGHDDTSSAELAHYLLSQDTAGQTGGAINAIDKESGLTLGLKRRFKSIATGGDEPLFTEDKDSRDEPLEGSGKRYRWFRPV